MFPRNEFLDTKVELLRHGLHVQPACLSTRTAFFLLDYSTAETPKSGLSHYDRRDSGRHHQKPLNFGFVSRFSSQYSGPPKDSHMVPITLGNCRGF
ncbi:hypothetical protein TGRH88_057340 [Toxoplasma gondii]|uniref:Uncharacterized protein n=1 Tax=Toxoplasma gondii TaxID=5811 RepID=A0A7J6JSL7_TOXGO|nr:hypothetical protein TGRH88_057340 [Toxoplasma gondii]